MARSACTLPDPVFLTQDQVMGSIAGRGEDGGESAAANLGSERHTTNASLLASLFGGIR